MKTADFRYERPDTLEGAIALLEQNPDATPLAGGQSLMPMMNFRLAQPEMLVDLNRIGGLHEVERVADVVRIGAMTRYCALERSEVVAVHIPLFAQALPHIAHDAIRNRGTIGGSVALADPAAEMPALLLALGATVVAQGPDGVRSIPAEEFFLGLYETALGQSELVTAIEVPVAGLGDQFGFYELARRHGDYAMVGVTVCKRGSTVRVAYFSVADHALRASNAEAVLSEDFSAVDAAVDALSEIEFSSDLNAGARTKRHLAGVVLRRALSGMMT